jgi:hypothetical protein
MSCDVCEGTPGRYPIHNSKGLQVFEIDCPACGGTGCTDEEWKLHLQTVSDRMRYEDAMRESRNG